MKPIRLIAALSVLYAFTFGFAVVGAQEGSPRLRVVLIVDSSGTMVSMSNNFRAGLEAFVDTMPDDAEIALVSTGGQLRIRVPPDAPRDRLKKAIEGFGPDGGGNALVETLLEADTRLMKPAKDRRQVYVFMTTDAESKSELPIDRYNAFMNDFLNRRGKAYAVVISVGTSMGTPSRILGNLTQNTAGTYKGVTGASGLKDWMQAIGNTITGK
ncbi:MAG: VWA domain-containing protein, partial [Acidobacteriaceae bacterium]|nr:VWA domain-containing protein [Acidobacteriaceae bacterium]